MKKDFTRFLLTITIILCWLVASAQTADTIEVIRNKMGKIGFARYKPNSVGKFVDAPTFLKAILQAKPNDEFRLNKQTIDKFGIAHQRYQQYYKELRIEGGDYAVHGKGGNIETINGDFVDISRIGYAITY